MRDWNQNGVTSAIEQWLSFDLTYEGLKLLLGQDHVFFVHLFWSYLWGIEISFNSIFLFPFLCFDLTYEGLKLKLFAWLDSRGYVLILPMRDWNCSSQASKTSFLPVLILPMRDWNEDFGIFIAGELAVLILPMRNCWLKAWFFVLYHSQLYKSPDKIPFIYFLKFFAFFPLFFLTFLCKISIISIFVLNFYKIIKFMKDSEKMCQSY
mgnify:CR=1 FL=1